MKKLIALILSLCMLIGMLPAMAETAAEVSAEAEKVDVNRLTDQILSDILNAVIRVDMEDAKANSAAVPENSNVDVFSVLGKVLTNIAEAMAKDGKENEDLNKLLAILNDSETVKNADEKELEALSALVFIAIMAEVDEREEKAAEQGTADPSKTIVITNQILNTIYDACKENEALAAAVKATESRLFEMLDENNKQIKEHVEKTGYLDVVMIEVDETSYAEFEAEIKKLEDYLNSSEGPKHDALDLLSLLHSVMDDIHEAIDGHSHDDAKEVDHFALVGEMLNDLGEAIDKVKLDEIKEKTGGKLDTTGSVYAVFEKLLINMLADEGTDKAQSEETVKQVLEMVQQLDEKDVTEEEAEAVFALVFLGLGASAEDTPAAAEDVDPEVDFLRSSHILKATYETMMENDTIKSAMEAVGSRLPEMLVNTGERMKNYLAENGTLHEVKDVDEAPFVAFEAEFAKLRDYIEGLEDSKRDKALAVLDLLHEYVDDIHQFVDGHTHEDTAK